MANKRNSPKKPVIAHQRSLGLRFLWPVTLVTALLCVFTLLLNLFLPVEAAAPPATTHPVLSAQTSVIIPINTNSQPPPEISAQGVIVFDPDSSTTLYAKNSQLSLAPASTTKIMTALVALKHFAPNLILTVTTAPQSIGSKAELVSGEQETVENILYALLLDSGNDAAVTLAQNYPGGYPTFVAAMNQTAQSLGLKNSHFQNVSGIDEKGHYMSASDLVTLTTAALKYPLFAQIVSTPEYVITSVDGRISHHLVNLNQLLTTVPGVYGVKTGHTPDAKDCLVTAINRDGHRVDIVLLGSEDRFAETNALIDWVYTNFTWTTATNLNI